MYFSNIKYVIFQPFKFSFYDINFGSVDEILSVSSNSPVLHHEDNLLSAKEKTETAQVNSPSHCSETVPFSSSELHQVFVPSSSKTDENKDRPTSSANVQVEASPPCSETDKYKVENPAISFQKRNNNSKVNKLRFP